jgi:hypothetical protein
MAALAHTRFAALALWCSPIYSRKTDPAAFALSLRGTPEGRNYQIDPKVSRQQRSVRIVLQKL